MQLNRWNRRVTRNETYIRIIFHYKMYTSVGCKSRPECNIVFYACVRSRPNVKQDVRVKKSHRTHYDDIYIYIWFACTLLRGVLPPPGPVIFFFFTLKSDNPLNSFFRKIFILAPRVPYVFDSVNKAPRHGNWNIFYFNNICRTFFYYLFFLSVSVSG